jgi:hypothetical protein
MQHWIHLGEIWNYWGLHRHSPRQSPRFRNIIMFIAVRLSPNKNVQIHQDLCYEDRD